MFGKGEHPEIFRVTLDPKKNPSAAYLRGTFDWHIDGCTDDIPIMATMLSAHAVAATGGETEFASTYAAYDDLTDDEKERYAAMRVVHTIEASQRLFNNDPIARGAGDLAVAAVEGAPAGVAARAPAAARSCSAPRPTTSSAWTPTRAGRCSTTCWPGRPPPIASTATSGRSATSSSGTTAACSTGRCPYDADLAARHAPHDVRRRRADPVSERSDAGARAHGHRHRGRLGHRPRHRRAAGRRRPRRGRVRPRTATAADDAAAKIGPPAARPSASTVDVTDRPGLDAAVAEVRAPARRADGARQQRRARRLRPVPQDHAETWNRILEVNLTGTFHCCQAVAARHDRRRLGPDRQHLVVERPQRPAAS